LPEDGSKGKEKTNKRKEKKKREKRTGKTVNAEPWNKTFPGRKLFPSPD